MKPAMMAMIGPMALLLATLTTVVKPSNNGSTSRSVAGGSKNRTGDTSSSGTGCSGQATSANSGLPILGSLPAGR
jgi:hypothetical protein